MSKPVYTNEDAVEIDLAAYKRGWRECEAQGRAETAKTGVSCALMTHPKNAVPDEGEPWWRKLGLLALMLGWGALCFLAGAVWVRWGGA